MRASAGRLLTTACQNGVQRYAPLLERKIVRTGFALPRRERFFNHFHRSVISQASTAVAKIRTTEGTTVSSDVGNIVQDAFIYAGSKGVRVVNKMVKLMTGKAFLQTSPDDPGMYDTLYRSPVLDRSISILKDARILRTGLTKDHIHREHAGRLLTAGQLLQRLS